MIVNQLGNSHEVNKQIKQTNWEVRKALSDPNRANPVVKPDRVKLSAFLAAREPYVKDGALDLDFLKQATTGLDPAFAPSITPKPVKLERKQTKRIYFWFDNTNAFFGFCKCTGWPLRRTENPLEGISGVWEPALLKNFLKIKDYPSILSRDCVRGFPALTEKLETWVHGVVPYAEITHVARPDGDIVIEFTEDLSADEVRRLKLHPYPQHGLFNLSGLEGCSFHLCRFCLDPKCLSERYCPAAKSKMYVVPTVSFYQPVDVPQLEKNLCAKVHLGKPGVINSACSSFVTLEYATGQCFLDNKSEYVSFCKGNCPKHRRPREIRSTQIVNICGVCGENSYSRFCKCPKDIMAPVSLSSLLGSMDVDTSSSNVNISSQNSNPQLSVPQTESVQQNVSFNIPNHMKSNMFAVLSDQQHTTSVDVAPSIQQQSHNDPSLASPGPITPQDPNENDPTTPTLNYKEAILRAESARKKDLAPNPTSTPSTVSTELKEQPKSPPISSNPHQINLQPASNSEVDSAPLHGNQTISKSSICCENDLIQYLDQAEGIRFVKGELSPELVQSALGELCTLEQWSKLGNHAQLVAYDDTLLDYCVLSHSGKHYEGVPMTPSVRSLIAQASAKLVKKDQDPKIFDVATLNHYPNAASICRPHCDVEKETARDGRTIIIPVGGHREFTFSTHTKQSDPGYVQHTLFLDDQDCLLISRELNLDPRFSLFHSKGRGVDKPHFTIAARVYNGPSQRQKRSADTAHCRDLKRARTENDDEDL